MLLKEKNEFKFGYGVLEFVDSLMKEKTLKIKMVMNYLKSIYMREKGNIEIECL